MTVPASGPSIGGLAVLSVVSLPEAHHHSPFPSCTRPSHRSGRIGVRPLRVGWTDVQPEQVGNAEISTCVWYNRSGYPSIRVGLNFSSFSGETMAGIDGRTPSRGAEGRMESSGEVDTTPKGGIIAGVSTWPQKGAFFPRSYLRDSILPTFRLFSIGNGDELPSWDSPTGPSRRALAGSTRRIAAAFRDRLLEVCEPGGNLLHPRMGPNQPASLGLAADGSSLYGADEGGRPTRLDPGGEEEWRVEMRRVAYDRGNAVSGGLGAYDNFNEDETSGRPQTL